MPDSANLIQVSEVRDFLLQAICTQMSIDSLTACAPRRDGPTGLSLDFQRESSSGYSEPVRFRVEVNAISLPEMSEKPQMTQDQTLSPKGAKIVAALAEFRDDLKAELREKGSLPMPDLIRLVRPSAPIRHPDDVAWLRSILNEAGYDADPKDIQDAYSEWSETNYAAGWACLNRNHEPLYYLGVLFDGMRHEDGRKVAPHV